MIIARIVLWVLIVAPFFVCAKTVQPDSLSSDGDSEYHDIGCFQRPKFFEISYRTLPSINAYPAEYLSGDEEFESNRLLEMKLSIPFVMKDNFRLIGQLRYKNEILNLGENDFYERKIKLNNAGFTLAYQWFYQDSKYIAGHASGSFKSDEYKFERMSSILDYNSSFVWGMKNGEKNFGIGVLLGNSFGRFRIAPLLIYENQLSEKWHLKMKLPKELTLTHAIIPDNFYLKGTIEGNAAAYFLNNPIDEFSNIEYRRSAVDLKLGLEKEIKDFIWVGMDVGITQPINSVLVEPGKASRFNVHDFNHQFTPFVNFSLFAVPPRSLYKK